MSIDANVPLVPPGVPAATASGPAVPGLPGAGAAEQFAQALNDALDRPGPGMGADPTAAALAPEQSEARAQVPTGEPHQAAILARAATGLVDQLTLGLPGPASETGQPAAPATAGLPGAARTRLPASDPELGDGAQLTAQLSLQLSPQILTMPPPPAPGAAPQLPGAVQDSVLPAGAPQQLADPSSTDRATSDAPLATADLTAPGVLGWEPLQDPTPVASRAATGAPGVATGVSVTLAGQALGPHPAVPFATSRPQQNPSTVREQALTAQVRVEGTAGPLALTEDGLARQMAATGQVPANLPGQRPAGEPSPPKASQVERPGFESVDAQQVGRDRPERLLPVSAEQATPVVSAPQASAQTQRALTGPALGTAASATPPAAVPSLVASLAYQGGGQMAVVLHPQGLGEVVIVVKVVGESAQVQLRGSQQAIDAISRAAISDSLAARGFQSARVDVMAMASVAVGAGLDPRPLAQIQAMADTRPDTGTGPFAQDDDPQSRPRDRERQPGQREPDA